MSDYNRGAYTPPSHDAPLAFDARRPVRGGSPAPVTLIISALVLVVLIAGAWFIYRDGFRGAGDAPKAVGTPVAEAKTPPKAEDQPAAPADDLVILNGEEGDTAPAYAPEPEQPLPRPEVPVVAKAPVAPVTAGPGLKPAVPAATPKVAPTPPPAKVATAPVAPVASTPKAAAGGSFLVQIGALSSTALADKAWNEAAALSPGADAGKGKKVETVESGGKTLYRTSVTGFADRASAQAFCDKLKAAGKSCFVR
jgi:hypothetical protein